MGEASSCLADHLWYVSHVKQIACALIALGLAGQAASASADLGAVSVMYGGTVSRVDGDREWQPSLWFDLTWAAIGPLHPGGYVHLLGESFPLDNPGVGGGLTIQLRFDIKKLRLNGAFNTGYLNNVAVREEREGAWNISAFGGLGYAFLSWMAFEVRFRWMRYFRLSGGPDRAWTPEGGLVFFIP